MSTSPDPACPHVAYLGPQGTFTEQALQQMIQLGYLPEETTSEPVHTASQALDQVRAGQADFACVALESSVGGPVAQVEDSLVQGSELQIYREVLVPVAFSILTRPGTCAENIATFATHPVAQAQVRGWLENNIPSAAFVSANSNAAAAAMVAAGEADAAAAPARAGELYGLVPLAEQVADVPGAFTRFVLVGTPGRPTPRTGNDRTGVAFSVCNRPGSLLDALSQFSARGVDMARISSRPLRQADGVTMGTYIFHVGLVGHLDDDAIADALAGLHRHADSLFYLGSWPVAEQRLDRHGGSAPPDVAASQTWVRGLALGRREGTPGAEREA